MGQKPHEKSFSLNPVTPSHNFGTASPTYVPRIFKRPQGQGLSAYVKSDTSDYTQIWRPTFYVTFQTPTSQLYVLHILPKRDYRLAANIYFVKYINEYIIPCN